MRQDIFQSFSWQTDHAGKSLWASECEMPPIEMLHPLENKMVAILIAVGKACFDNLLSLNLY